MAAAVTAVRPEIWLLFLIVCALGTLFYLREEGFAAPEVTLLPGYMIYVFDSKKADTESNNRLAQFLKERSNASPENPYFSKFKIDDSHAIYSVAVDLDREEFKEVRPFFPNSMGLYINTGGGAPGLYLNNDFGPSRITDAAAAEKLFAIFLHAKSQADLAKQVSQHFYMYLEERPDVALMEQILRRAYNFMTG